MLATQVTVSSLEALIYGTIFQGIVYRIEHTATKYIHVFQNLIDLCTSMPAHVAVA